MKAATYSRYSSDQQRETSIADQRRNCQRYAEREGWKIVAQYEDKAISGSKRDRAGYQQMLADAEAKAFDVLLVDDLSRFSRDDIETKTAIRRLKHWGVRLIGVSDGFDSDSKGAKVQASVRGLMNELYLDDLAEKTHRGLTGKALAGFNTGGRAYGYRHIPIEDKTKTDHLGRPLVTAVKRVPDPKQAKIIKQIFEWYTEGYSARWIADELNRRNVPSPGANWKRETRRKDAKWLSTSVYTLLENPLYVGRVIWNRSQWVKNPETEKKVRRERPEAEWIVTEDKTLRIVTDELWKSVQARRTETHAASKAIQAALHKNARTGAGPKYLFSGLLKCAECGRNFVITDAYKYGCGSNINGGKHACGNQLRVNRRLVEAKLLEAIKQELFSTEAIELFKKETTRLLAERRRAGKPDLKAQQEELAQVEQKIASYIAAIEAGTFSPSLKAALERAEARRAELQLTSQAEAKELDRVAEMLPRAVDTYRRLVGDLGTTTQREVSRARSQIKHLLGEIRLVPAEDGSHLVAELVGDYAGLLKLTGENARIDLSKINVVAGAGFEPATFGL